MGMDPKFDISKHFLPFQICLFAQFKYFDQWRSSALRGIMNEVNISEFVSDENETLTRPDRTPLLTVDHTCIPCVRL